MARGANGATGGIGAVPAARAEGDRGVGRARPRAVAAATAAAVLGGPLWLAFVEVTPPTAWLWGSALAVAVPGFVLGLALRRWWWPFALAAGHLASGAALGLYLEAVRPERPPVFGRLYGLALDPTGVSIYGLEVGLIFGVVLGAGPALAGAAAGTALGRWLRRG